MTPWFVPIFLISLTIPGGRAAGPAADRPFRFHVFTESQGVDPQATRSANGDYVFHLLYRGLFAYRRGRGLVPVGARSCRRSPRRLTCALDPRRRWSDGSPVRARDYVASFRRLVDPERASPQADTLSALANWRAVRDGRLRPENLGIRARGDLTLEIDFARDDPEFEYKLIHPALSPYPPGGYPDRDLAARLVTNGPYRVRDWKLGSRIGFANNAYFDGNAFRPPAEAWFIEDDETALSLYEAGRLDFLRRLVAREIPRFERGRELSRVPMARFDYVGFGPALAGRPRLRRALAHGVDYAGFLKLFDTLSPPGCPSLPRAYFTGGGCQAFTGPKPYRPGPDDGPPDTAGLQFWFSRMGGEDIARAAEWFQAQWAKNLGIGIELRSQEQGGYVERLRRDPPALFRKGVTLDRPTCRAGLEIFTRGHPENYVRLDDPVYDRMVAGLAEPGSSARELKSRCGRAIKRLLDSNRVIPLGEMNFTVLAKPDFSGWELNELNQLDLSALRRRP